MKMFVRSFWWHHHHQRYLTLIRSMGSLNTFDWTILSFFFFFIISDEKRNLILQFKNRSTMIDFVQMNFLDRKPLKFSSSSVLTKRWSRPQNSSKNKSSLSSWRSNSTFFSKIFVVQNWSFSYLSRCFSLFCFFSFVSNNIFFWTKRKVWFDGSSFGSFIWFHWIFSRCSSINVKNDVGFHFNSIAKFNFVLLFSLFFYLSLVRRRFASINVGIISFLLGHIDVYLSLSSLNSLKFVSRFSIIFLDFVSIFILIEFEEKYRRYFRRSTISSVWLSKEKRFNLVFL